MTADRPEVVAWRWRKPVVNDHGETVGGVWELGGAPAFLPWWTNEPLVRLGDYEALQAECEQLQVRCEARDLRVKAEAINQAINNYFNTDNGPHGLKENLEWQAQRLRDRADDVEQSK